MVLYQSKPKSFPSLNMKAINLLFLGISVICFLSVTLVIFFDADLKASILNKIEFPSYQNLIIFTIVLGILFLLACIIFTKNRIVKMISCTLLVVVSIVIILSVFVVRPHRIIGGSMLPTIKDKEYVFGNLLSYRLGSPQRGDIVIFDAPGFPEDKYIARIIGLPNEKITVENCGVYINMNLLKEVYLSTGTCTKPGSYAVEGGTLIIPADSYFMMADNRSHSLDSRYYGFVKFDSIREKALYIYWPLNSIQTLSSNTTSF